MHAKTDSDATSFALSSPEHNRRPAYYVQSPSRDSHDGEKTNTASFHSTPVMGSPMGSPPHSNSSVGRHSRESSTSRFSGSLKPGSRKISPNDAGSGGGRGHRKPGQENWKEFDVIEEEGLLEGDDSGRGIPRRCYVLGFVVGFFVLFSLFALILYGASKPQKPVITMRSIRFNRFVVQAGSDDTGVSTDMISLNATAKFTYHNTATFFGLHVSSTPFALSYTQLNIGSGDMKTFYTKRKGHKEVSVTIIGDKIPMYGSGATLTTPTGITNLPVPLRLEFTVRSRGYVLGKLVKPKFNKKIECSINFVAKKLGVSMPLKNLCTYD